MPYLGAWLEPRTLAIGVFVLAFAFAEGTANDWSSLAAIDGYHLQPALGTLVFATFLAAMTAGRWFSPVFLDRYGRVPVVRLLGLVAIAGVALFVFGPAVPFAFVGRALMGSRHVRGVPAGNERRRRRTKPGCRPGQCYRLSGLLCLPGWATTGGLSREPTDRFACPHVSGRSLGHRRCAGAGCAPAPAHLAPSGGRHAPSLANVGSISRVEPHLFEADRPDG